jgi:hypothetical protein
MINYANFTSKLLTALVFCCLNFHSSSGFAYSNNVKYKSSPIINVDENIINVDEKFNIKIANASDGFCSGTFRDAIGNVTYNWDNTTNTLYFAMDLSPNIFVLLGGETVTVTIYLAVRNGAVIASPYREHTKPLAYNFHGRLRTYQTIGLNARRGQGIVQEGDLITLYWLAKGSNPRVLATLRSTCRIPHTPTPEELGCPPSGCT